MGAGWFSTEAGIPGSWATNLVQNDTNNAPDIFVYDQQTRTTTRVSEGLASIASYWPAISADGRYVAFHSVGPGLQCNVFVHDRETGVTTRVSTGLGGAPANGPSLFAAVSTDGNLITFESEATNLVTNDTNGASDVFVYDQTVATTPLPPTEMVVHSVIGTRVTLRWTDPTSGAVPTGFVVEGGLVPGEVLASFGTGSTAPTVTFDAPAGSYYVRVRTLNGTRRSDASDEIYLHVNVPVAPSAPSNLLGLADGSNLTLVWTDTFSGGAPTSLVLDVTGSIVTSLPLGLTEGFGFAGVPPGSYTLALRALNAAGSSPQSNTVTLSFPGVPCSGAPLVPTNVFVYRVDRTVYVDWASATSGPAPTGYVLNVTGAYDGTISTTRRAVSRTVSPGEYTVSIVAVNPCGASAGTAPQTILVP